MFSLMALIGDPVYEHFSKGFRGPPRIEIVITLLRV